MVKKNCVIFRKWEEGKSNIKQESRYILPNLTHKKKLYTYRRKHKVWGYDLIKIEFTTMKKEKKL